MKKRDDGLVVGGMTLAGLGIGFALLEMSPLYFLAAIFVGLGLGLTLSAFLKK